MNDREQEEFELQLRRIEPAQPPEAFTARLLAARPRPNPPAESPSPDSQVPDYLRMLLRSLRWAIPATAVVVCAMVIWRGSPPSESQPGAGAAGVPPVVTADDVQVDQQWVSSFDAIARLPDGEPVRFRCETWMDEIVLSDKSQGIVYEKRAPRLEIVAMGYETY